MVMQFKPFKEGVPVLAITESGSDMVLTMARVGIVQYDRADSEALAIHLEQAAKMVRENA